MRTRQDQVVPKQNHEPRNTHLSSEEYAKELLSYNSPEEAEFGMAEYKWPDGRIVTGKQIIEQKKSSEGNRSAKSR